MAARKDVFSWTDDEVELMLRVSLDYKTAKLQENVDWETCRSKYSEIWHAFQVQYPRTPTEEKDFPHDASAITKVQLTAKIKHICIKYRQAVDLGRRSGQGRVVLMFFELCEEVWGGSPATRGLSSGIETGDLEESSSGPSSPPSLEHSPQPESSEPSGSLPAAVVVRHRRDLLQAQLNGHRSDLLKRTLPADHAVEEDLKIKKRMVELMELMEQTSIRNADGMQQMNATIRDGFSLMRDLIHAHPHSSSSGHGHFQEQSSPFMQRRPHPPTPTYTPRTNSDTFSYRQSLFVSRGLIKH